MSNQKMTAEEAAECLASRHSGNEYLNELDEACEVAIARLRANCGNCQHFGLTTPVTDDPGASAEYREPQGFCVGQRSVHDIGVPADGSGGCTHAFKAKETA